MNILIIILATILLSACKEKEAETPKKSLTTNPIQSVQSPMALLKSQQSYNFVLISARDFPDSLKIKKHEKIPAKLSFHAWEAGQIFVTFSDSVEQITTYNDYIPPFLPLDRLYNKDLTIHFINNKLFAIEIMNSPYSKGLHENKTIVDSIRFAFDTSSEPYQKHILPKNKWIYIQCTIIKGQCAQAQEVKPASNGQWEKVLSDGEAIQE